MSQSGLPISPCICLWTDNITLVTQAYLYLSRPEAGKKKKSKLRRSLGNKINSTVFTHLYVEKPSHEVSTEASSPEGSFKNWYNSSAHPDNSIHRPASVTRSNQTIHLTIPEAIPPAVLQEVICRHKTAKILQKKQGNPQVVMESDLPGSNWRRWISGLHHLLATDAFRAARGRSYKENSSHSRCALSIDSCFIAIDQF